MFLGKQVCYFVAIFFPSIQPQMIFYGPKYNFLESKNSISDTFVICVLSVSRNTHICDIQKNWKGVNKTESF